MCVKFDPKLPYFVKNQEIGKIGNFQKIYENAPILKKHMLAPFHEETMIFVKFKGYLAIYDSWKQYIYSRATADPL